MAQQDIAVGLGNEGRPEVGGGNIGAVKIEHGDAAVGVIGQGDVLEDVVRDQTEGGEKISCDTKLVSTMLA